MKRSEFVEILTAMNGRGRRAGACTPTVCEVWRRGDQSRRIVDAVLAWEHKAARLASAGDMEAVVSYRLALDAEMKERAA